MPPYRLWLRLRGHAQFRFQLQHNWRPGLQRWVARCRQCNVIRANRLSYLSGLLRSLRTLFPFLFFQLVFHFSTWPLGWGLLGFAIATAIAVTAAVAAIFMCVHHRAVACPTPPGRATARQRFCAFPVVQSLRFSSTFQGGWSRLTTFSLSL